jgi:glycosyltransferase involved in cell wall biosynthesis
MKIVYLHQYFNTPKMPGGTRSYEMAKRLVERGHEVHVITSFRNPSKNREWVESTEDGIFVHWLPVAYANSMSYFQRTLAFFKFAFLSSSRARAVRGDIVFATSTPLTICIPAILTSKLQRIPMIFEVRDLWPELPIAMGALSSPLTRYLARCLERVAYNNSSAIVALSPGMRDGVVSAGYPSEKIHVIPNACDISLFDCDQQDVDKFRSARPWLRAHPLIVYAGTLGKINGVEYLVEIANRLKLTNPCIRILVVGDGSERRKIHSLATEYGVLGINFFMEPPLPKKDMPVLFGAATIVSSLFIDLPEMRANSANKFFDGLAAGKPILLNYGGWQSELVKSHSCGIVTWGKTLDQSAVDISTAIDDLPLLCRLGECASSLAHDKFDRNVLADEFCQVLEAEASGRSSAFL